MYRMWLRVYYAKGNDDFWESNGWRCPMCWVVIVEKRYPSNIEGATTIFACFGGKITGETLGDWAVFEVVQRVYFRDNPDENVIFLRSQDFSAVGGVRHLRQFSVK